MTLNEFLDLVPWGDMEAFPASGPIRCRGTRSCPICAVWGGWNSEADEIAKKHGLSRQTTLRVIAAADGICETRLRARMLRRMRAAERGAHRG